MHSSHLSAALLSSFECSSPTPRCKSTVYHGNRPNRRNTQSRKKFTFSAKGWDKDKVQLQTVQHPELAATNSEPRTSLTFSNFWRNQSVTRQGGKKKMQGNRDQSRYNLVQWLWWLCCRIQLCSSSSLPCGWELGQSWHLWLGCSWTRALRNLHPCSGCWMWSGSAGEMPSKLQFSSKRKGLQSNFSFFWCKSFS